MSPIKLIVKTKSEKYPIIIGRNLISNLSQILKKNSINFKKCLLVFDKNIPNIYVTQISRSLKRFEVYKFIYNANEKNKDQKNVNKILDFLLQKNFSRDDCLISIGVVNTLTTAWICKNSWLCPTAAQLFVKLYEPRPKSFTP